VNTEAEIAFRAIPDNDGLALVPAQLRFRPRRRMVTAPLPAQLPLS